MQCGRVGGCLLYLRSSESNDFGDLFFVSVGELALRHYFIVLTHPTHSCLRSSLQLVHYKGALVSARLCRLPEQEVHQLINTCTNRSLVGAAETAAPPDPCRYLQILVDTTCIFQPLITSKPIGCAAAGRYGRFFSATYL